MDIFNENFYPIIIVGASIAGCAASYLYADKGHKVLLLDKTKSLNSYKKHCTHFVQPCGVPVLKKIGAYEHIDQLGLKSKAKFWTSAGWIESKRNDYSNGEFAINLERSRFDPYLKRMMKEHPLIDLNINTHVKDVKYDVTSKKYMVKFQQEGTVYTYYTNLLIAADGRYSKLAQITSNEATVYANDRFVYSAYYKDLDHENRNFSKFWMLGKHMAFIYPQLDNYSLVALFIHDVEKQKWKQETEVSFNSLVASLPDGPNNIAKAERVGPIRGVSDIRSFHRLPLKGNVPFIGDSVLSLDPAAGTGFSFALISSNWLVNNTIDFINNSDFLNKGLEQYSRKHNEWMDPHIKGITADSLVTKDINADYKFYTKVIGNETLKEAFLDLTGRLITAKEFQKIFIKSTFSN